MIYWISLQTILITNHHKQITAKGFHSEQQTTVASLHGSVDKKFGDPLAGWVPTWGLSWGCPGPQSCQGLSGVIPRWGTDMSRQSRLFLGSPQESLSNLCLCHKGSNKARWDPMLEAQKSHPALPNLQNHRVYSDHWCWLDQAPRTNIPTGSAPQTAPNSPAQDLIAAIGSTLL